MIKYKTNLKGGTLSSVNPRIRLGISLQVALWAAPSRWYPAFYLSLSSWIFKFWVFLDITRAEGHHISVVVPETTNIHLNTYLWRWPLSRWLSHLTDKCHTSQKTVTLSGELLQILHDCYTSLITVPNTAADTQWLSYFCENCFKYQMTVTSPWQLAQIPDDLHTCVTTVRTLAYLLLQLLHLLKNHHARNSPFCFSQIMLGRIFLSF